MKHADVTIDANVPARDECVVRYVFEKWVREQPDAVFAKVYQGPEISYRDFQDVILRTAAGLAQLGVKQGDTVVVWAPNGLDCLRVWLGINWLGAIYVPINVGYRGNLLQHVIGISGAKVIVAHHELAGQLNEVDKADLEAIVLLGGRDVDVAGLKEYDTTALDGEPANIPPLVRPIEPWDPQSIIFTSGTTGPSKGVLSSYAHMYAMSGRDALPMLSSADRYMCNLPLFHVGGTIAIAAMLARGGSVSIVSQFSTSQFWDAIDETQTTFVILLGAMASFINGQPQNDADREHALRHVIMVPLLETAPEFGRRFGIDIYSFFNMTEVSVPIISQPNPTKPAVCGKPRKGVQVRLVDDNDIEVPDGEVGQLIIRTDAPWAMNSGYFGDPEATARAWRNGWFHTGDLLRKDEDGDYLFVDRAKDAVRRRGENVSSFEVESELLVHPDVKECAVVPVPADISEDDILCVVVPHEGRVIDPVALLRFLEPRLAHFMLPRYIRVLAELPKTPTQKVEKYVLRRESVTADTWDREAAGFSVRRQILQATS